MLQLAVNVAILKKNHAVTERCRKAVVRYHKNCRFHLFPRAPKRLDNRAARFGIQISRGFIGQNHQRTVHQTSCHSGSLFLTAGNFRGILVHDMSDAKQRHEFVRKRLRVRADFSLYDAGHENILPDCQAVQQHEILKNKAQFFVPYFRKSFLLLPCQ